MSNQLRLEALVPLELSGSRFDQVAANLFPDYSRSRIQDWIRAGELTLNGKSVKPNTKLGGGEMMQLQAQVQSEDAWEAQDIPLDIVFEDRDIIVINKAANLVVHPAAGNRDSTVLNGLIFRYPELREVPRAGIVHRLDKDTTGLMVVARTLIAQTHLVEQLQARSVKRVYHALAMGELTTQGAIDKPIGRHPTHRTKMAVVKNGGKPAISHYRPLDVFNGFTYLRLQLETGRTHQIRVHMAELGYPLVGDQVYGRSLTRAELKSHDALAEVNEFPRQALHAKQLAFVHPQSGKIVEFRAALPDDFLRLLDTVRHEL